MKLGDTITAIGPNGAVVGVVVEIGQSGRVFYQRRDESPEFSWLVYLDDEGRTWIYGEDEAQRAALVVAYALSNPRMPPTRRPTYPGRPLIDTRRKGTV